MRMINRMKDMILVLGIVLFVSSTIVFAESSDLKLNYGAFEEIILSGKKIQLEEEPFSIDGNRMLPLRSICEGLGYQVSWDQEKYEVKVENGIDEIVLIVNDNTIFINGEPKKVYFAPKIVKGRTYVIPAVIQASSIGLVEVNPKGDFAITGRSSINESEIIGCTTKNLYKENEDGILVGMAQIKIPYLRDLSGGESNFEGPTKINKYFENYAILGDELRNELKELSNKEFIDTIYIDHKVLFESASIISVKYNYQGRLYDIQIPSAEMFNIKTGEKIKNNEIFKNNELIYEALTNAYKNGDKGLIEKIEELKEEIKFDEDIWNQWGVKGETDDSSIIYYIAESIKKVLDNSSEGNDGWCWLSGKDGRVVLNFVYYGPVVYRSVSIDLDNVATYIGLEEEDIYPNRLFES